MIEAFAKRNSDGIATEDDKDSAALAARRVTIDFARAGVKGRQMNRYFAFFNAAVQSLDKNFRLWYDVYKAGKKEGAKAALNRLKDNLLRISLFTVLPALVEAALRSVAPDDDKKLYDSGVNTWKKDTNWVLMLL